MSIEKQIYIIALVFFLLAGALILFFVYPLSQGIQQNSRAIVSHKNNVFLLQKEFNESQNFQKKYETYKPNLNKLDQMFVDSKNPVDFIKFIEKTGSDYSIKTQISTPSFSKEGLLSFSNLQITSSGEFSKVLKFINALESGNYLAQVQNLTAVSYKRDSGTGESATETRATFNLKVFAK